MIRKMPAATITSPMNEPRDWCRLVSRLERHPLG
jgi:hypothetical protein